MQWDNFSSAWLFCQPNISCWLCRCYYISTWVLWVGNINKGKSVLFFIQHTLYARLGKLSTLWKIIWFINKAQFITCVTFLKSPIWILHLYLFCLHVAPYKCPLIVWWLKVNLSNDCHDQNHTKTLPNSFKIAFRYTLELISQGWISLSSTHFVHVAFSHIPLAVML